MADHPIPDDLTHAMTLAFHQAGAYCGECDWESALGPLDDGGCRECQDLLPRYAARAFAALTEWADGALIDPNGWRRLDAPSALVTKDTPAKTIISTNAGGEAEFVDHRHFDTTGRTFWWGPVGSGQYSIGHYADGWVEVRRPEEGEDVDAG